MLCCRPYKEFFYLCGRFFACSLSLTQIFKKNSFRFSTKFKYWKLWWTVKWFRDFVRCRCCCRRGRYDALQLQRMVLDNIADDHEEKVDDSYSLMTEDGDENITVDYSSSVSRVDSKNRRSIARMPVIETFTGMF